MPMIQTPQWTEFLSCPVCYHEFNENIRRPISLGCGHTVCKTCLSQLQRKQCPFDQAPITQDIDGLPANYALLQLVGAEVTVEEQKIPANVVSKYMKHYAEAKACIEELALYLKPLGVGGAGSSNCVLSRPMQRKLVTLVNCQLVEEEGRARAMRAARSLGERTVTELMLQHQNTQQLSANLWAAVRARGCQFLGPAMQEETLKLVLLALEDGAALSRKVLVMFVVQKLEQQFPQASKTSVGHVVQLLYRASCFKVTKREEESSLMQLKEEFRNYEALRREHDAQIVLIAMEGGLRISPEQWSSLLYGDLNHKSHMQSIIDKLQTPASFTASIQELTIALQRSGDPANLGKLRDHLKLLADINPIPESEPPAWEDVEYAMISTKIVVHGLVEFISHHSHTKKILEQQQTQNIKYKTSMCRDITQKGGCPRGNSCTFAHSEDELERYRAKSRRMLSTINRQNSNQSVRVTPVSSQMSGVGVGSRLLARGMESPPPLNKAVNPPLIDPEGEDDGLSERNSSREAMLGLSPHHNVHSPELVRENGDERSLRYPPNSRTGMQIPYRPPGHYDQYMRDYRGQPSGPPPAAMSTKPPPRPSSTTQFGRMLHGPPIDQLPTRPPMHGHQDNREEFAHPAHSSHYLDKESRLSSGFPREGARRDTGQQGLYPSPYQRYTSPLHSDYDTDRNLRMEPHDQVEDNHPFSSAMPPSSGSVGSSRYFSGDKPDGPTDEFLSRHSSGWSSVDGQDFPQSDVVEKQERETNEKETEKGKVDKYLRNIETPANIPTNLIELQQRKQELLDQLNDYRVKSPWEYSAVTKVVSTNQGRPKSSVVMSVGSERYSSHQGEAGYETSSGYKYFDPWTSSAPLFTFLKPGKEHGTKYTMTVSKSQVKHVSAKETEQMALEKPHHGIEHPEFTNMNLAELRKTLEKVTLQDQHTGCTHFERSQELNQELLKREQTYDDPPSPSTTPSSIPSSIPSSRHIPIHFTEDMVSTIWGPPVSKASRTSFNITPPVKVNAGPTGPGGGPPCTPVSINLNNQMVPVAGQSPVTDKNIDLFPRDSSNMTPVDQRGDSGTTKYKEELEHELAHVKSQIARQRTAKTANDAFLIQRETRALQDTHGRHSQTLDAAHLQVQKDMEMARRLQNQEFQGRSTSPYSPTTFNMDQDFPPLNRDILDQEAQDKRLAAEVQRLEEEKAALKSFHQRRALNNERWQQHQQEEDHMMVRELARNGSRAIGPRLPTEQHQEQQDQNYARHLARAEAHAMGVRLPPERNGYGGASEYPW